MRNRLFLFVVFAMGAPVLSLPAVAQVYFPPALGGPSAEAKAAAAAAPKPTYDPHDLTGVWRGVNVASASGRPRDTLMGGAPPPPMTAWGREQFNAHKPSEPYADDSRKVPPAQGNDPLGNCDPLGYPRNLGTFEILQTPTKIVQVFQEGLRIREIWIDGRKLPDDVDPRWYGWAVGRWEGGALVVDSKGYDGRTWLDGNGYPHSEDMTLHEVFRHPDATTLEITMTLTDPTAYTQPWVGKPQMFRMLLPKDRTELYESFCVPSEEQSFNEGVRNPAGGVVTKK